eukprot:scaffold85299_cov48-Phaeocystis_antarctica.AAC.1
MFPNSNPNPDPNPNPNQGEEGRRLDQVPPHRRQAAVVPRRRLRRPPCLRGEHTHPTTLSKDAHHTYPAFGVDATNTIFILLARVKTLRDMGGAMSPFNAFQLIQAIP